MSSFMQRYEKKVTAHLEIQDVFEKTLEICKNWLIDTRSIKDVCKIEHILQHRVSGFSGHIFYTNTVLNGIDNYYSNRLCRKGLSLFWATWEYIRSLTTQKENIIGEFKLSLDKKRNFQTNKVDICFVVSMENYLKVLVPIINSLIINGKSVAVITICDARSWQVINELSEKVNWIFFEKNILEDDRKYYEENIKLLKRKWKKDKIVIKENIKKVSPYVYLAVRKRIHVIFSMMIPRVWLYEKVFARLLDQLQPKDLVVVRLRRSFDITGAEVAKEKGIRTSLVIHGQIFSNIKFFESDGFFDTDIIYTWGKFQEEIIKAKQKYMQVGECKNFGNPLWDGLFRNYGTKSFPVLEKKKYNQRTLLYMGQGDSFSFFEKFIMAIEQIDNIFLLVKPHPYEDAVTYKSVVDKYQVEAEIIDAKYNDIDVLIRRSDIAYTYTSTTGINIMLNQVPLVTLNFNKEKDIFLVEEISASPIVESIEELFSITQRILDDVEYKKKILKGQRDFMEQQLECGGTAVDKIVDDLLGRLDKYDEDTHNKSRRAE